MAMATVVPVEGPSGQFAATTVLEFVTERGTRGDGDNLQDRPGAGEIEALMTDVVKTRGAAITVLEKLPVGSGGSNGVVERGVQSVEGFNKTLLSACEERFATRIRLEEKIVMLMAWRSTRHTS